MGAPRDAFLMASPVAFQDELAWVGSIGLVYTLPMFRIAGIYAPANGEFNTLQFEVPEQPLWINANARWYGKLITKYDGVQGCDEGCAAYLYATVLDATTGDEIPGYGVEQAHVMMDADGLRLPLQWKTADGKLIGSEGLVGKQVRLRIYFRDTTVYAVGAG